VLTLAAAICLVAALAIDVSRGGSPTLAAVAFAVAGMAFVLLASAFPRWPRHPRRSPVSHTPHFGHTRHGLPVHARTIDHHKAGTVYQRFNKRVALALTTGVGNMTCFWIFCGLALCSLPAVLSGFSLFAGVFPSWMVRASDIALVAWIAQTFIQLVLLPAIMVGQSIQNEAADARSAKTFEDVEAVRIDLTTALDRLDEKTEGGLKAVLDAVNALAAQVTAPKAVPAKRLATRAERGKGGPASG